MKERDRARLPLDDVARLAALADPVRRRLYELVVAAAPRDVSRGEAARGAGVKRGLAAFHLDRLVEAGLLDVRYRRLGERAGPGAGRPAKLYGRSSAEVAVSLPLRQYGLAARLLLAALERAGDQESLVAVARGYGREAGRSARAALVEPAGPDQVEAAVLGRLKRDGFEPTTEPDGPVRLRSCPFDALVADHRETVCAMNLALIGGVVEGAGPSRLTAEPRPAPGFCCVALARR